MDCREVRTDFDCYLCYIFTVEYCKDITIDAGLTPNTNYYLVLFDQFDIKRIISIQTDEEGMFKINKSDLPDNYFNPFGSYDFYISTKDDGSNKVSMVFDDTEYNCVILIIE